MPNIWASEILEAAFTTAKHPVIYARVLMQLGHEPLQPTTWQPLACLRPDVRYPNVFKYLGHIRKSEGFLGMYTGLGANIVSGFVERLVSAKISTYLKEKQDDNPAHRPDELPMSGHEAAIALFQESAVILGGIVASQPFQVIMVRQMAQFVGHETNYVGFFASIKEIYHNDGISGFFSGLVPRALFELVSFSLTTVLAGLLNEFVMPKCRHLRAWTRLPCSILVWTATYPLSLVSHVMAVNGSGLQAGEPTYADWRVCYAQLSAANQLRRGSSMFWRKVPKI